MRQDRPRGRRVRGARAAHGLLLVLSGAFVVAGCSAAPPVTGPPSPSTASAAPATGVGASDTAPKPAASPVLCTAATLSVTLGPSEGAAGTVYAPLRFTNRGTRACVISGFPGVSYVTGDRGAQVGPAAQRDGARGTPVMLAPGAVASATLAMVQVRNYDAATCRPTPVRGLRVYPPGSREAAFVPLSGTGCAGNPPGPQLRVSSVTLGPGPG